MTDKLLPAFHGPRCGDPLTLARLFVDFQLVLLMCIACIVFNVLNAAEEMPSCKIMTIVIQTSHLPQKAPEISINNKKDGFLGLSRDRLD